MDCGTSTCCLYLCREELLLLREEADKKICELETRCQELQAVIQRVSEDFQTVSSERCDFCTEHCADSFLITLSFYFFQSHNMASSLEKSLHDLQAENESLKLQLQKVRTKVAEIILSQSQDLAFYYKTVKLDNKLCQKLLW